MNTPEALSSVWACGQTTAPAQRAGRYLPESAQHPAKMMPALARHAIAAYSKPGDTVADPMCGIGTVPAEAIRLGRHGIGADYEQRWADIARGNLALAMKDAPADVTGRVWQADARKLTQTLPPDLIGTVDLIVTSPPYGSQTHGLWRKGSNGEVVKRHYQYGDNRGDRAQLAHHGTTGLYTGIAAIIAQCARLLSPGGTLVLVCRPWHSARGAVNFAVDLTSITEAAGFAANARHVGLLARWNGQKLIARNSFFALHNTRRARAAGKPRVLVQHEDVLVFRLPTPPRPVSSGENHGHQGRELEACSSNRQSRAIVHNRHIGRFRTVFRTVV